MENMQKNNYHNQQKQNRYNNEPESRENAPLAARKPRQNRQQNEYVPRSRATRGNGYSAAEQSEFANKQPWYLVHKKKIILGLAAIGGLAIAIGIAEMIGNAGKVQVVSSQPALVTAQQPYQDCDQVKTTRYVKNHKNGTEGAVIGGVGGAAVGGLVSHSWVGAGVGAAVGAVGGDLIQRSNQPEYVAHHSSTTQCQTAYRQIQVPIGYQIGYLDGASNLIQITTQHQAPIGTKVALTSLQADQLTPQQQQLLVQQAINGSNSAASGASANQTITSAQ